MTSGCPGRRTSLTVSENQVAEGPVTDGTQRSPGGRAILPGRRQNDVVKASELPGIVATFLDAPDRR
jgi:hypothetical protein